MHAYEILFSPTGGTAKVAAALTTDWSSVKTIDLSIPSCLLYTSDAADE